MKVLAKYFNFKIKINSMKKEMVSLNSDLTGTLVAVGIIIVIIAIAFLLRSFVEIFIAPRLPNQHPAYLLAVQFINENQEIYARCGSILKITEIPIPLMTIGYGYMRYELELQTVNKTVMIHLDLDEVRGTVGEKWTIRKATLICGEETVTLL